MVSVSALRVPESGVVLAGVITGCSAPWEVRIFRFLHQRGIALQIHFPEIHMGEGRLQAATGRAAFRQQTAWIPALRAFESGARWNFCRHR